MSTKIMMPQAIDLAIKTMCVDSMIHAIKTLSEKYGFDAEEAQRMLTLEGLNLVRKQGPAADKKEKADKKKAKKEAKKDKPKRKPTGYLLFSSDHRSATKSMLETKLDEGKKLMSKDVTVELAKLWSALTSEEKAEWNATAKANASESEPEKANASESEPEKDSEKESASESESE